MSEKISVPLIKMMMMMMIWMYCSRYYFDVASQAVLLPVYLQHGGIGVGVFDGNGLDDFMVGGKSSTKDVNFYLYKQNRSMIFCDITNGATFPTGVPRGFNAGRPLFVDINGDGSMDLFYTGSNGTSGLTNVYLQSGASSTFFRGNNICFPSGLPQASSSYADFADADKDGLLDLLLIGGNILFCLFRQNASHAYTNITNTGTFPAGLPTANMGSSWTAWHDYDSDGLQDFTLIGGSVSSILYRQNSTFIFFNVWNAVTFPMYASLIASDVSGTWTDFDGNGMADFAFLNAYTPVCFFSQLTRGVFTYANTLTFFPAGIMPGFYSGVIAFADLNGDGFQDLFVSGISTIPLFI